MSFDPQIPGLYDPRPLLQVHVSRSRGHGLGDVPTDKTTFDAQVAAGDEAMTVTSSTNSSYVVAATAYQSVGNFGVTTYGPDLDTQTGNASQSLTQQAATLNTQLQAIDAANATAATAQQAQSLVKQMQALYNQAGALPAAAASTSTPTGTAPAQTATTTTTSSTSTTVPVSNPATAPNYDVAIAAGTIAVGAGLWWWLSHRKRR